MLCPLKLILKVKIKCMLWKYDFKCVETKHGIKSNHIFKVIALFVKAISKKKCMQKLVKASTGVHELGWLLITITEQDF